MRRAFLVPQNFASHPRAARNLVLSMRVSIAVLAICIHVIARAPDLSVTACHDSVHA